MNYQYRYCFSELLLEYEFLFQMLGYILKYVVVSLFRSFRVFSLEIGIGRLGCYWLECKMRCEYLFRVSRRGFGNIQRPLMKRRQLQLDATINLEGSKLSSGSVLNNCYWSIKSERALRF